MSNPTFGLPWPGAGDRFLLRPDVAFLNHGSFGACPQPVFDAYHAWQRELEAEPVDFLARRGNELLAEARTKLGTYVGTSADNLVFVTNATVGTNIVAHSLDLQPGDEVLGTDHEYGAADRTWRFNCARRGARYVTQPISLPLPGDEEIVEQLWQGVTEHTRLIFISHITSPTAVIFPVAEICKRARAEGILTMIDGAHVPGQLDLALDELDADFYTGNCHKWLCSPKSAGFLYARPELQEMLQPLIVSWGWESEAPGPSRFIDYFTWVGTADPSAYLSVGAAIDFQHEHDWPKVREACHQLALWTKEQLVAVIGSPPICNDNQYAQMCAVEVPVGSMEKQLGLRLWDEYKIEVPISRCKGREFLRVSIQAYNSTEDIERLVSALKTIF